MEHLRLAVIAVPDVDFDTAAATTQDRDIPVCGGGAVELVAGEVGVVRGANEVLAQWARPVFRGGVGEGEGVICGGREVGDEFVECDVGVCREEFLGGGLLGGVEDVGGPVGEV